ncbi:hypothetical protein [Brevundimonas sp.]|uniref:hypothetical protein n=1 Tax=Brevundimonas sp. TaxID=1871086 RepID=UPI002D657726|nr:hypothetical protein [Brevundimonas sp.]HYD27800.1 hypothetical protein [Brevundimonas sp.]
MKSYSCIENVAEQLVTLATASANQVHGRTRIDMDEGIERTARWYMERDGGTAAY